MKYRFVWLASVAAVGALYYWIIGIGALPERFVWQNQFARYYGSPPLKSVYGTEAVNGYYQLLARSFASGKLRLPVEPVPELLALPDPWNGSQNWNARLLDVALFQRHYYLYHGPTPVVLFFLPWYGITGRDLPENFAAFLISLLAFVVLSALFREAICALGIRLSMAWHALFLIALGVGQVVPFLLHRAKVYEVAIACAQLCVATGFYCAFRSLNGGRRSIVWAACSGLSFGLAVGCRPHFGLAAMAGFFLFAVFARKRSWRELIAYVAPLAICGVILMAYNYARFQNPFEFGTRYLLGDDRYRNFGVSLRNLPAGLYYLLFCPPRIEPEFPFVRLVLRSPGFALPRDYFLERIAGALLLCPLIVLAPMAPFLARRAGEKRAVPVLLTAMVAFGISCVVFIALVPFSSQRYAVDFMPSLLFASCVAAAALLGTMRGRFNHAFAAVGVALALSYAIFANLALAVQGPYDQFVQRDPRAYVHLARRLSPVTSFRPLLDPTLRASSMFNFPYCPAAREALLSAGELGSRYQVSAECAGPGRLRLFSETALGFGGPPPAEVPFTPGPQRISIEFTPANRTMTVYWNENPVLRHALLFLVTSRSQIRYGWDAALGNIKQFEGQIEAAPGELGYLLK
jgi:hypothetical protein